MESTLTADNSEGNSRTIVDLHGLVVFIDQSKEEGSCRTTTSRIRYKYLRGGRESISDIIDLTYSSGNSSIIVSINISFVFCDNTSLRFEEVPKYSSTF